MILFLKILKRNSYRLTCTYRMYNGMSHSWWVKLYNLLNDQYIYILGSHIFNDVHFNNNLIIDLMSSNSPASFPNFLASFKSTCNESWIPLQVLFLVKETFIPVDNESPKQSRSLNLPYSCLALDSSHSWTVYPASRVPPCSLSALESSCAWHAA